MNNKKGESPASFTDTVWMKEQPQKIKKVFVEPVFRGGDKAWSAYLVQTFTDHEGDLKKVRKSVTCYISFIVDTDGSISSVKALNLPVRRWPV